MAVFSVSPPNPRVSWPSACSRSSIIHSPMQATRGTGELLVRVTRFTVPRNDVDIAGREIETRTGLELADSLAVYFLPRRLAGWNRQWRHVVTTMSQFLIRDQDIRAATSEIDANAIACSQKSQSTASRSFWGCV